MGRYLMLGVLLLGGCDPAALALLASLQKKTEHLVVVNQPNYFYRSADHHNFKSSETYSWRNCGETAIVDLEVEPSCPNDITVSVYDSEDTLVFLDTFHAPHCWRGKKDWPPVATAEGVPGVWRITLDFDIEGVKDLQILITGSGDCDHEVCVHHGNNGVGNGEDPQPPGQPPINDGPGSGPGVPGNHDVGYLLWRHKHCRDRDVTETYYLRMNACAGAVDVDWSSWTSGTLRLTVKDSAGLIVYEHTFSEAHAHPWSESTSFGQAGTWSLRFEASDLSAEDLRVTVAAP